MLAKDWISRNCRFATMPNEEPDFSWMYDPKTNPYRNLLPSNVGYDPARKVFVFEMGAQKVELQLTDAQCRQINEAYRYVRQRYEHESAVEKNPPPWLKELIWKKFPAAKRFYFYAKSSSPYIGVNGDDADGKSTYLGKVDETDAVSVGHSFKELVLNIQPPKQPVEEQPVKEQPAQEM